MSDRIGPYELIEKLGSGGMGTVYRARQSETGQIVAVKTMRQDLAEDSTYIRRFKREAEIAASVRSPNVVEILEAGEQDGVPYIAMELVDGEPLSSLLKSGPLQVDQALDVATQVAQGLLAAFDQGVIHRDISPQNILVTPDGIVKIGDFGIARSRNFGTLTATGMFIGKPSYAAPEAFGGHTDTRSDIYSLGIVLFEMLSGRPPFLAPSPLATMELHVNQPPPRLIDLGIRVTSSVQQIVGKSLSKDPRERYQTPRESVNALTAALQGHVDAPIDVPFPASQQSRATITLASIGQRKPLLLGIGGSAVLAIAAVAVAWVAMSPGDASSDPTPTPLVVETAAPTATLPTPTPERGSPGVAIPPPLTASPGCAYDLPSDAASYSLPTSEPDRSIFAAINCANATFVAAADCGCTDPLPSGWTGDALTGYQELIGSGDYQIQRPLAVVRRSLNVGASSADVETCESWETESGATRHFNEAYKVILLEGRWIVSENTFQPVNSC